jgi:hypothetical protein
MPTYSGIGYYFKDRYDVGDHASNKGGGNVNLQGKLKAKGLAPAKPAAGKDPLSDRK